MYVAQYRCGAHRPAAMRPGRCQAIYSRRLTTHCACLQVLVGLAALVRRDPYVPFAARVAEFMSSDLLAAAADRRAITQTEGMSQMSQYLASTAPKSLLKGIDSIGKTPGGRRVSAAGVGATPKQNMARRKRSLLSPWVGGPTGQSAVKPPH